MSRLRFCDHGNGEKATLKARKAHKKAAVAGSGGRKSAARREAARVLRTRPVPGTRRTSSPSRASRSASHSGGRRADSGRSALKRSSPHPSEAVRSEEMAVATLDAALAGLPPHSRAPVDKMQPRFPEDDYDYTYLHDFLGLDGVPRDCRAVVFGCGKGEEAVFFSERGYRVTGIDSDRNSIGLARERAWLNARDIDFMIGDVFESANLLPAESFGLASDRGVFRAVQGERERRRYLDLVRRLLLPGGLFLVTATEVDRNRKAKTRRRRRRGQDDLLVQEGGEVMGEILRAGLTISGRKHYALPGGDGKAELLLYCRR